MIYGLNFTSKALQDIQYHKKAGNKALCKKIENILKELREHPTIGTGHPEQLRHHLSGLWSRKITDKHRLVYRILETEIVVEIISAEGHYGDK